MAVTRYWPFGPHGSIGNNLDGIGAQWRALNANGVPCFYKGADGYGPIYELMKVGDEFGIDNVCVFRMVEKNGIKFDVPDWSLPPEEAAANHVRATIENLPPEFDQRVWLEIINEPDKDSDIRYPDWDSYDFADWLGEFAYHASILLLSQGYKPAMFGFSAGEPEIPDWTAPGMINFLELAEQNPDHVAVALHEYSYNATSLEDATNPYPWQIGRFTKLFEVCDLYGIARPKVLITEFGWTLWNVPPPEVAMPQLEWAADIYASYPEVLGVAIWHYGEGWKDIRHKAQKLLEPMAQLAMTWRKEIDEPMPEIPKSDGFDSPVGTSEERSTSEIYPGHWVDVNPWMNLYVIRPGVQHYHTGSDLNLNYPSWDSDRFKPVYATANGVVKTAEVLSSAWGKVMVIEHEGVYSRYAHLDEMLVSPGDVVDRGQQIGTIGRNLNDGPYHLHFDISHTSVLDIYPGHWPGTNAQAVRDNYLDPVEFIKSNRPKTSEDELGKALWLGSMDEQCIQLMPEAALQKAIFADDMVPVGNEYRQSVSGVSYACQVAEHLARNDRRVYACVVGDWDNVFYVDSSMEPPPGTPTEPPVEPPKPEPIKYDLSRYFLPPEQYGAIYEVRDPDGSQRRVQHQIHGDKLYITKGTGGLNHKSEYEELYVGNDYIWRGLDTSPGNNRYYIQAEPGYTMARWCKRFMAVGETFIGEGHRVQFYYKNDCSLSGANSGPATNVCTFFDWYASMNINGINVPDVIHIGREDGEEFWFAEDIGMVGWKSDWNESWISELHAPGQRPNNEMEVIPCLGG